jgi:hypothetical protein
MALRRKDLMAKAAGITVSIGKKPAKDRDGKPSGMTADDYNRLRDAALAMFPHLGTLLPPRALTYEGGAGTRWSHQTWNEIDVYAEQIFQLLDVQEDPA